MFWVVGRHSLCIGFLMAPCRSPWAVIRNNLGGQSPSHPETYQNSRGRYGFGHRPLAPETDSAQPQAAGAHRCRLPSQPQKDQLQDQSASPKATNAQRVLGVFLQQ